MIQNIGQITLLVKDYDDAIKFYTQKLEFQILEDTKLSEDKRWVIISPQGNSCCNILLAKATNEKQIACVGNQTGGRVFLFLYTDDFFRDYEKMIQKNIKFLSLPRNEIYGTVAVFEDLYGNLWDFIQKK